MGWTGAKIESWRVGIQRITRVHRNASNALNFLVSFLMSRAVHVVRCKWNNYDTWSVVHE
jgi:hypothetical protein